MSKEPLTLEQVIEKLREAGMKVSDIYEATGKDKMEYYNILRSNNEFRKKAYLNELIKTFPNELGNLQQEPEANTDLQTKYIQALERENTLLEKLNNETLAKILQEISEIKKRLET